VSGYGLDDRAIGVRFSAEAKGFFSPASVSRPALEPIQTPVHRVPEGPVTGAKARPGRDADHSLPASADRSCTSYLPKRLRGL
jgi:hypothetical protein